MQQTSSKGPVVIDRPARDVQQQNWIFGEKFVAGKLESPLRQMVAVEVGDERETNQCGQQV